jgi:Family of unknown function (DUF6011)
MGQRAIETGGPLCRARQGNRIMTGRDEMNDSLDNLFAGDTGPVRVNPVRPAAVEFKSAVERFEENCPKCGGRGRFISYAGRDCGPCFTCKGKGKKVFKSSAADRAKARESAATRKANRQADLVQSWAESNPAEYAWLQETAPRWHVAASLLEGLAKFGSLTGPQMNMVQNGIARDAERAAKRQAAVANAPAVDVSKLETAFATARKNAARPGQMGVMVKPIKLQSGEGKAGLVVKFTPGSIGSQWEGMIFAKSEDGRKLGHVKAGRFVKRFECTESEAAAVVDCVNDPHKAAVAYGKAWSRCCICGRGLLNDESIARSMGPICAERFGW